MTQATMDEIASEALRYTWIGYYLLILILSFTGGAIILTAATVYKAFKLHQAIIVIIEHLAVIGLVQSASWGIPRMVSLMTNEWNFGEFLCFIQPYLQYHAGLASMLFISAMTVTKLIILKFPTRSASVTSKKAHIACVIIWIFSTSLPIILHFDDSAEVKFSYRAYNCDLIYLLDSALTQTTVTIFLVLPYLVIVVTTALLIKHLLDARKVARRSGGTLRWQGIMAVIVTAVVYSISVLPYTIYRFAKSKSVLHDGFFDIHYYRIASSLLTLNVPSNLLVYCLTVPSFRKFLQSKLKSSITFLRSRVVADTTSLSQGK